MRVAMHLIPTNIKILKALMSNELKSPLDVAIEIDGIPYKVKDGMIRMKNMGILQRPRYAKYTITPKGRGYFKRIVTLLSRGSKESEK